MLKLVSISLLLVLASARPQDGDSSQVNTEILFETIEAKPAPAVVSVDASYAFAIDLIDPATQSQMNCLKASGYSGVFVRAFAPTGSGYFDTTSVNNIKNANSAGLLVEVYMSPQPYSALQGYQQLDLLCNGLTNNGIYIRAVWIQVTSAVNWSTAYQSNTAFIDSIISRAKQYGLSVGIYTNQYDWSQITGNWYNLSSDVVLWYWHVLGTGASGETPPNFDDFRAFGPFNVASVKQFAKSESVCSLILNREVYAVGIPAADSSEKAVQENDKIVVGGVIGF